MQKDKSNRIALAKPEIGILNAMVLEMNMSTFEVLMGKLFLVFSILSFLLFPYKAFAAYTIELNCRSTYMTNQYWEENDQIKFYHFGGIVGISKYVVKSITESDTEYVDPTTIQQDSPMKKAAIDNNRSLALNAKPATEQANKSLLQEKAKQIDFAAYKNKKKTLMAEYSKAKDRLRQVIASRDRIEQKTLSAKIRDIEKKRAEIAKEIREKNNGILPKWWRREYPGREGSIMG